MKNLNMISRRSFLKAALAASVVSAMALTGCGGAASSTASSAAVSSSAAASGSTAAAGETFKVGIVNYVDHASLNQIVESVESRLDAIGKEKGVTFDYADYYANAQADQSNLNQIGADLVADGVDVIVAVATAATFVAMMMVIGAMDVTVGDLFGSGGTHITNSDAKVQIHTRQRVVGINLHKVFGHFDHSHRTVAIIGIGNEGVTFGHFHAVKQFARDALHQIVLVFAVGFRSRDIQFETVTDLTVIQGFFQTRNQETGPMQVNQRLMAFGAVQHVAGLVRNGIVEGNNAQMAYFHVTFPVLAPRHHGGVKIVLLSIPEKARSEHTIPRAKMGENGGVCALCHFFCV